MCSHRGRLAVEDVPPGSLGAYAVLHKAGVSCYDVDFVQTRDGQLVASHPQDLLAAVAAAGKAQPPRQLGEWSLAELRAAGADEERFPTADALIKVRRWGVQGGRSSAPCSTLTSRLSGGRQRTARLAPHARPLLACPLERRPPALRCAGVCRAAGAVGAAVEGEAGAASARLRGVSWGVQRGRAAGARQGATCPLLAACAVAV